MPMQYDPQKKRKILDTVARVGVLNMAIVDMPNTSIPEQEARKIVIKERDRLENEIWLRIQKDTRAWEDLR